MQKYLLAVLVDNKPGVLTHVSGLISRRAFNIESISAGYTEEPSVTRINTRADIFNIVNIFRAKIVDLTTETVVIELTGDQRKIDAICEVLNEYEIVEIARTGAIALSRGSVPVKRM